VVWAEGQVFKFSSSCARLEPSSPLLDIAPELAAVGTGLGHALHEVFFVFVLKNFSYALT
jgi:hypothetical protein